MTDDYCALTVQLMAEEFGHLSPGKFVHFMFIMYAKCCLDDLKGWRKLTLVQNFILDTCFLSLKIYQGSVWFRDI